MQALKRFWRLGWEKHPRVSDETIIAEWDDEPTQQMLSLVEVQ
jgi:hypothetical protein